LKTLLINDKQTMQSAVENASTHKMACMSDLYAWAIFIYELHRRLV